MLTRGYPDGSVDTGFGQQGSILFSLGPDNEGPGALRLDPTAGIWIAGATAGRGDTLQALVLRFLAHGAADAAYAEGGRALTAPAGRKARAGATVRRSRWAQPTIARSGPPTST